MEKVKEIWEELKSSNNFSYFFSWTWIEQWILSLPRKIDIKFVVFFHESKPVAAYFIGSNNCYRYCMIKSNGRFLNATGRNDYDLCLEYNMILTKDPNLITFAQVVNSLQGKWNEFVMLFLDGSKFPGNTIENIDVAHRLSIEKIDSPYVRLDSIRKNNGDFLALLSKNNRYQIRRSLKLYKKRGEIILEEANDQQSAMEIYEELCHLHNQVWRARNKKGAFESEYFYNFHKQLITKGMEKKEIQLLRISVGGETIGCLYSFLYNNNVYFYQSGIKYEQDNKLKPGLVCHMMAIEKNAKKGYLIYDFLAEPARYKKCLSTDSSTMLMVRLQKRSFMLWAEDKLKKVVKKYFMHRN
ncbi:MAG: GNAT family N-acetyltransferase [Desulfobacteraceae bacterium]|nr:GNAT family N-acetyltransferase [Desulfobacteraceae bacterium]